MSSVDAGCRQHRLDDGELEVQGRLRSRSALGQTRARAVVAHQGPALRQALEQLALGREGPAELEVAEPTAT